MERVLSLLKPKQTKGIVNCVIFYPWAMATQTQHQSSGSTLKGLQMNGAIKLYNHSKKQFGKIYQEIFKNYAL